LFDQYISLIEFNVVSPTIINDINNLNAQCVKLTVATSPMATENYPLATYFVFPGAILGDQLP